ncbi:sugar ABC transporter substrate-binding protein [Actinokineospora sp. NBRC 105648]|uniref:sugar ABC transporter substrate-binding protein n=1 Tax=Actinokineospora sp. NBRC 105648 TaxID=3032206 RepID=UPI0024A382B9|nr:sugar ABC transporter substrate-binding protein [Actinokineospora sp. NBRC 105648]GLZ41215.1 hypothetical protein Acsp05_48390 [Actinokineospora sp. NBRC 105648]
MARPAREPTFLPLTLSTVGTVCRQTGGAEMVQAIARRADAAAAECWAALLAGCDAPGRHQLPNRLRELSRATAAFAGEQWWQTTCHPARIDGARTEIEEAVAERDGADFAEAFIGYDQAVATALVRAHNRLGSPTR